MWSSSWNGARAAMARGLPGRVHRGKPWRRRGAPVLCWGLQGARRTWCWGRFVGPTGSRRAQDQGQTPNGAVTVMGAAEDATKADTLKALAEGVWFTRDLVNEPSNVLTTVEFADGWRPCAILGLKVEVLEEAELEKLGMRTLLCRRAGQRKPLEGRGHGMEGRRKAMPLPWRWSARALSSIPAGSA